jgi:hypothetical protein
VRVRAGACQAINYMGNGARTDALGAVDGLVGLLADPAPRPPAAGAADEPTAAAGTGRPRPGPAVRAGILLRLTLRYALLGFAAYVMIARFRLHPIGLVIGASSIVVAASLEALRVVSRPAAGPRRRDR